MTNERIEKKIAKLDELADKNYRSYQDSGIQRYYRAYEKYEEEATLYRRVLNQNDEHIAYVHLKGQAFQLVAAYKRAMTENPYDAYETLRKAARELVVFMGEDGGAQ